MNQNQLIEKISNNWLAKIVCLVLAILLYWTYQGSVNQTRYFSVPLTVVSERGFLPVNTLEKYIRIAVKASPDAIDSLSQSDFKAVLDLNSYDEPGQYTVQVRVELSQRAQTIEPLQVDVKPAEISVALEEKKRRSIQVLPLFTGEPAEGYEVVGCSIQPQEIIISGPASVIDGFADHLTFPIGLTDRTESFNQIDMIRQKINNPFIAVDEPESIFFKVNILPCQVSKTYTGLGVYFTGLNPYFVLKTDSKFSITVYGAQNTLKQFSPSSRLLQADCSFIDTTGDFTLPVSVHLPEGLTLVSVSSDYINVKIEPAPVVLPSEEEE
ncbi:MAG: hypothetical protein MJ196_08180 [Treponemataceae bacterium]|nr:hypothetical protein [Treponemataceae bacterium]